MDPKINPDDLERLKEFIKACEKCPQMLLLPDLKFFRDFMKGFGARIPEHISSKTSRSSPEFAEANFSSSNAQSSEKMDECSEEQSEESEVELDNEGVIEPETEAPPEMGDGSKVVTEEDEVAASEKRQAAMEALANGDNNEAIKLFTEAIKLNPSSSLLYAKRASILIQQKRVRAALDDCSEAVRLNPDSAAAHKFRGRAHRLLGNWLEAAQDLRLACRLDFDDVADEWLKEVQPNANKLEEHQRKYERKRLDKEVKEKQERIRKAKEEHKKAQEREDEKAKSFPRGMPFGMGGMPGGMPGMPGGMPGMPGGMPGMPGGMPFGMPGGGGGGAPSFEKLFEDPDILAAMQDPEVAAAFQDVSSNPANIFKYQSNPKVAKIINKLMKKFGGGMGAGAADDIHDSPDEFPNATPSAPANDDLD